MDKVGLEGQEITSVSADSIAQTLGIRPGDRLLTVNGAPVLDVIDYEYLCSEEQLQLGIRRPNGKVKSIAVKKNAEDPLGLSFGSSLMSRVRSCNNHCIFCFIDQMPRGVRQTLHFKDDDWRMSFIMGNYVSLTNVDEGEFQRIVARRVSPLYVSVHTTDGGLRVAMMKNPAASKIMERLSALKDASLGFHAQIVLCPGINDGEHLDKTLRELNSLAPSALSVAIVPVGLTAHREGLASLRPYTAEEAGGVIDMVETFQKECFRRQGTKFAFLSDEWYILAGRALPSYEECEDFPQLENGVGLLRLYERDFEEALEEKQPLVSPRFYVMAGGAAANAFFKNMLERLLPYGIRVDAVPIRNDYFGGNVSVGGLITGGDLTGQLLGKPLGETLLIPHNMLRENEDVFLDGMTLMRAQEILKTKICPIMDGTHLIKTIFTE